MSKIRLAIFASGSGTNAENLVTFFKDHPKIEIVLIASNKEDAFVLNRAKKLHIPSLTFTRAQLNDATIFHEILHPYPIDGIVLAGFLLLIPAHLIQKFPNRIVNIHPALLPNYGGKGMYGMNVHRAVIDNGDTKSGITIHLVNEAYDEGGILNQYECEIEAGETADGLAENIHKLEYAHFPSSVESWVNTFFE